MSPAAVAESCRCGDRMRPVRAGATAMVCDHCDQPCPKKFDLCRRCKRGGAKTP